jgi:uncharacterized protein (UPF0332 family)
LNAQDLLRKASRAVASAELLFAAGDFEGACNRAYFAMFDAARAALVAVVGADVDEAVRTHNGLIAAFSLHLVKTGRVPAELGKALNGAEELRLIADYRGDAVGDREARRVAQQAREFVDAMRRIVEPAAPGS